MNQWTTNYPVPEREELKRLYNTGLSQLQLGEHYGVSQGVVSRWFAVLSIECRTGYRGPFAESHGNWKGDKVGYAALHAWVRRRLPKPTACQDCKIDPPRDLANISQKYLRDITDWEWLCRRCHMIKDGRIHNLTPGRFERTVAKCGRQAVTHGGVCMQQYNYLRRRNTAYRGQWAKRKDRAKPCESCQ